MSCSPPPPATSCVSHLAMGSNKNVTYMEALSDVAGSGGLVMEIAVCDLYQVSMKTSVSEFNLEQRIKLSLIHI